jgi:hypothetical protein
MKMADLPRSSDRPKQRVEEQQPDQQAEDPAPGRAARGAHRHQRDRLLDADLAFLVANGHHRVLEVDQVFLLQLAQLVQRLVGGIFAVVGDDH